MLSFKDHYSTLNVPFHASFEDIQRAYKNQGLKWHPDKNPGIDTTTIMQEINEARNVLSDVTTRIIYDEQYLQFKKFRETGTFSKTTVSGNSSSPSNKSTVETGNDSNFIGDKIWNFSIILALAVIILIIGISLIGS